VRRDPQVAPGVGLAPAVGVEVQGAEVEGRDVEIGLPDVAARGGGVGVGRSLRRPSKAQSVDFSKKCRVSPLTVTI
jgi:hypothetical protein